jgi:sugar/nucleoside kinase (ribokinase family)
MTQGVFVGLSTIDIVYAVDEFSSGNVKVTANSQDVFVGGPATNASIAFASLGGRASLVTAVGRHSLSRAIKDELGAYSIQLVDLNPASDAVPVVSSVSVDRSGHRNVVSANAARVVTPPAAIDKSVLDQAGIVLVDGHYMQACETWAKAARSRKTPVVFDGGSWKDGTGELLKDVSTAICSADFLPPGCSSKDDVLRSLKDSGVANVAITDGGEPIHFLSGASSGTLRVPEVEVVDTMGAGDVFHGAFCYFALNGRGFVEALAEAAEIAAESCRYRGTREWATAQRSMKAMPAA